MRELIANAWTIGWQNYTKHGKLVLLLFVGLLLFWFAWKEHRQRYHNLIVYTTVMAVACILPLTVALLMSYQTRFYDYQWIWNLVPSTIVSALAGSLLWSELTEYYGRQKGKVWKCTGIAIVLVAVICLCGRIGLRSWDIDNSTASLDETKEILALISEGEQQGTIVLWAPREIMEYARIADGTVQLVYGRNMWDASLSTYSYDTYSESVIELYEWMSHVEKAGLGPEESGAVEYVENAINANVNHIILPGNTMPEILQEIQDALGIQAQTIPGYYWLKVK